MIDKETLDSYRRGVDSGVMKSATPNVVRHLLDEIELLQTALRLASGELSSYGNWVNDHPQAVYYALYSEASKALGK